jgi:hypothetical protein
MNASVGRKVIAHRVLSATLGAIALLGWSLFTQSAKTATTTEETLRGQIASIEAERAQLITERDQLKEVLRKAKHDLALQLDAAYGAAEANSQQHAWQSPEPTLASPVSDANAETGSIASPSDVKASIRTAQTVLARLGYGPLTADGAMGARTRRALEAFERDHGLMVTGELGPHTVTALRDAAEAATVQVSAVNAHPTKRRSAVQVPANPNSRSSQ